MEKMNQSKNLALLKSQHGMSLIQVLVGLAILSIVGFSAAHLSGDAKRMEVFSDMSSSVNQIHLLSIQKTRNLNALKIKMDAEAGVDLSATSPLSRCLAGFGLACTGFNMASYDELNWTETHELPHNLDLESKVSYRISCASATSCELIHIKIQTNSTPGNQFTRTTDIRVAGTFIGERPQIAFNCAGTSAPGQFVTGVNFQNRQASCGGMNLVANCTATQAVTDFDTGDTTPDCVNLANRDCPSDDGFLSVGALNTQGTCQ